jgi:hypothetical protein
MTYRLTGRATEFCSCSSPCPCAFGQEPDNGRCHGLFYLEVQEGEQDGVSLTGTKAVLADTFAPGPWTAGGFVGSIILDSNAGEEQRAALRRILTGEAGGDAAGVAALFADLKGVVEAPFDGESSEEQVSLRVGDLIEAAGTVLKNADGSAAIEISNAHYPLPNLVAGKASTVKINVEGVSYDGPGSGMWTGPFELNG